MTKAEALFAFWSRFGLAAFEENAIPTGEDEAAPEYPYLTYEVQTDGFGSAIPLSASLWFRSASWRRAEEKKEKIARHIGRGGVFLPCDGGSVWIRRGSPFAQRMGDGSDDMVKRMYLNISVEFWTED